LAGINLTKAEISKRLEISDPFLFLDQIEALIPGKSARGFFQLNPELWFFKSHLPKEQAMPGTLLTETMLQTLVLALYTMEGHQGKLSFVTETKTKLFSKVSPGEKLVIEATLLSYKRGIAKGEATVTQAGKRVAFGEFSFASPHDLPRPISPVR
jgi:3-hydroxyacyl-[acyl-carrier-protein] dehydratase